MELLARDLVVNGPGGTITGLEDNDGRSGSVTIRLTGNLELSGKIRVNGTHGGGVIRVHAAGNILIPESGTDGIEADGTGNGADGGDIVLEAGGTISVYDPIHAAGAGPSGADSTGGSISIEAEGDIITATDGHVSAEGVAGGGGAIDITSTGGDVTIQEHVDVDGRSTIGDGGEISISAFDHLEISQQLTARGGVNASGGEAYGGRIELGAGCGGVSVSVGVLANGGQLGTRNDSGDILIESRGGVTIASGALLDVHSLASVGHGGDIDLTAGQGIVVSGSAVLDAHGGATSPGSGGHIRMNGCTTQVSAGATVDATGHSGGTVEVSGRASPPAQGTQPVIVSTGALLKVAGVQASTNGRVDLAPAVLKAGKCFNLETPCVLDSDCTVGCDTRECLDANPNTDGIATQFDVTPQRREALGAVLCDATCVP